MRVAMTGKPPTGTIALPGRPHRACWAVRLKNGTCRLTVEGEAAPILLRLAAGAELDDPPQWATCAFIDSYEWRITADEKMTELTLWDDLPQRTPVTAEQIAEWEKTWPERLAALDDPRKSPK